jgi:glycosyltransferase-like protein
VSQLRVALLTYSTRPRGGVVHTLALAEALAAHDDVEVTVVTLGRGGDDGFFRAVDPAVTVELVPFPDVSSETVGDRILRSIRVLAEGVRHLDHDVVHAQDCISANAAGGDCVRTVHHLDHFTTPELVACHERAIVEPHTHVCVSASVAQELVDGWGIGATVIPNGVAAQRFAAAAAPGGAPSAARAAWRERLGDRFVLAVGGIEPRKGTRDLVEAMGLLRATHPDVPLVVAGGETLFDYREYRDEVLARVAALDVRLEVLGAVDDEALPALVAAATVEAFPSTKEGFGLAAMEALAAGVPLVCRDLPVLREVFGPAATFFDDVAGLAAALATALDGDHPVASSVGRALADGHTWEAAATAHLELYRSLV